MLHFEVLGKESVPRLLRSFPLQTAGEGVPFTLSAASRNCTLVPGIVPLSPPQPPVLFSVVGNKTQLLPGLHLNRVTAGLCRLTGPCACVYVQRQDRATDLSAFPKTFQADPFSSSSNPATLSWFSISKEKVRRLVLKSCFCSLVIRDTP